MEETIGIEKQVLDQALEHMLDKSNVPIRYHLKIIEELKKTILHNSNLTKQFEDTLTNHKNVVTSLQTEHQKQLESLKDTIETIKDTHQMQIIAYEKELKRQKTLLKGEPGKDSPPVNEEAIVSRVLSKVPAPEKGDKGDKGDTLEMDKILETVIKRIQGGDVIHISNVKGAQGFVLQTSQKNVQVKFEELMHGSGSSAGSGKTLTQETPSGVVDGSNTTFTVTHTPVFVMIDGNMRVSGYGYTYSAPTITVDPLLAPVQTIISFYNA